MKKIAISFIVFSLAASADLSVGEIEKMVEQIHKKREGIHLETLQETKEPFVRLEEDEATKLVIPEIIEAKLTLHAIVNGKAYISNAWVGVEENIMGYTLKYIGENGVVLRKGNSIKKLFLSKNRNGFIQVEEREVRWGK